MRIELQNKLFEKYPELFQEKDLLPSQTCMCWGIDTGDGWYDLIDNTCKKIMEYKRDSDVKFVQVKEKFAGLRIYFIGGNDQIDRIVDCAECRSFEICEECGSKSLVKQRRPFGWIYTMCLKCHIKCVIKRKFNNFIRSIK